MELLGQLLLISDLFPIYIDRYKWQESQHPRQSAGSSSGGEFRSADSASQSGAMEPTALPSNHGGRIRSTKKREIAVLPDTITQGHSLHVDSLSPELATSLKAWSSQLQSLMAGVESAQTPDDQEIAWASVDKDNVRQLLAQMNVMDKQHGAQTGEQLSDWVNANALIPRSLAERLDGGERFFNPEKIRRSKLKPLQSNGKSDQELIRQPTQVPWIVYRSNQPILHKH